MKIAYVAHWDLGREGGVLKKIATQMRAWIREGNDVKLFALSPTDDVWAGMRGLAVDVVLKGSLLSRFLRARELVKRIISWRPEAAYLRFGTYYPSLEVLTATVPTFLEINADNVAQSRAVDSRFRRLYHHATRGRMLKRARGMVLVAKELSARLARYKRPMVVIGNSIDLSEYHLLSAPKNPDPRLVFIGSPGPPWHGLDKILWLAGHFVKWQFHLIGIGPADLDEEPPSNVSASGLLNRTQYEEIMARADAAIGTLSLHKIGMDETSPLKVREYLAYGIPSVIGYRDTDFPRPVPFLLELPNTPDNVIKHAPRIEQFVQAWRGKRVPRKDIAHLDVGHKEKKRLQFIRELAT